MKKYEAVIILNPNLSSKVDEFKKDFNKLFYSIKIKYIIDFKRFNFLKDINRINFYQYCIFL